MENDVIVFKLNKEASSGAFFMLVIFLMTEVGLAIVAAQADSGYLFLCVSAVFSLFFLVPFFVLMNTQKKDEKAYRAVIDKYGEDNLRLHIQNNTIKEYRGSMDIYTVYFTDKLIVLPSYGIVSYNEIAWMYRVEIHTKYSHYFYIELRLYNGKTMRVCMHVDESEVMDYINFIYQHNSKILVHKNVENEKTYSQRKEGYRLGIIKIPPVDITKSIGEDEYDYSGMFPIKKRRFETEEELEEYVMENYSDEQSEEAAGLIYNELGVSREEAQKRVYEIFSRREELGLKLDIPYEWTEEGKRMARVPTLIVLGVGTIIMLFIGLMNSISVFAATIGALCTISIFVLIVIIWAKSGKGNKKE